MSEAPLKSFQTAILWAKHKRLEPVYIDCVTTVMLKILDGKCKMLPAEKETMEMIYDELKDRKGKLFGNKLHQLIASARENMDEDMVLKVYEQRLYAETMLGRPIMKTFKAMLRKEGIIGNPG